MNVRSSVWPSAIVQKAAMAVSGLVLFGFVVGHMLGNLQIYMGPEKLNAYAALLKSMGGLLWAVRGGMDRLAGGPGLRRGRRSPEELAPGDALDFWRVEAIEPDRLLRLRAEMRLPGRAWLQFEVQPDAAGGSRISQTAIFEPLGVAGLLYWYSMAPVHGFIFDGMLKRISQATSV